MIRKNSDQVMHLATAMILDAEKRMLLVRKKGTEFFMQPGGKTEAGELPEETLVRELREELMLDVVKGACRFIGCFESPAANEPDMWINAHLYYYPLPEGMEVFPCAELDTVIWVVPGEAMPRMTAPFTRTLVAQEWRRFWS